MLSTFYSEIGENRESNRNDIVENTERTVKMLKFSLTFRSAGFSQMVILTAKTCSRSVRERKRSEGAVKNISASGNIKYQVKTEL